MTKDNNNAIIKEAGFKGVKNKSTINIFDSNDLEILQKEKIDALFSK